jgi:predicted ester cyclase
VTASENIAFYRRFIEEAASPSQVDRFDEFLAPGIDLPTLGEGGVQALKDVHALLRAAFPDMAATIDEIFANDDWVAARLTWTGTHEGLFLGIEPTGRTFAVTELEIVRIANGRIIELRELSDMSGLVAQLSGP